MITSSDHSPSYLTQHENLLFAGCHVLIDLWGAHELDNLSFIQQTMEKAASACGATILSSQFHHFTPNHGVTGVTVLSQSHVSIHTWPEHKYAAIDCFMCGPCNPLKTLTVFQAAFQPTSLLVMEHKRGLHFPASKPL